MQIICNNPKFILNPLLPELLSIHGNITIFGKRTEFIHPKNLLYETKKDLYSPVRLGITDDNCDSCYVSSRFTDETFPVYIKVPCGHCELCKESKRNAFVDRCKLETQLYNSKPLFITLTYDDIHKRKTGVSVRDIQLFLKRFRIRLYRKGYREKIRYVVVSEYGSKTHRPHYHAIFWNCHQTDFLSYFDIRKDIEACWSNGFVYVRQIQPDNDKAFYYTAKYMRKDCAVPDGCNPTFLLASNRCGGIGAQFLYNIRKHAAKYLNTELRYVNKWSHKAEKVRVSRYMLNKIVPSLSCSLPYSLRMRVRRFIFDYSVISRRNDCNRSIFDYKFELFYKFFSKYFYIYRYDDCKPPLDLKRSTNTLLREMLEDEIYIDSAMSKGRDYFDDCLYYSERREPYLLKLFKVQNDIDLSARSYKVRRDVAMAIQREIL